MEVHHHSHSPRRKWTHYFWEFLMLFLAVFCGFLAENEREHFIEHKREKIYINQMIQDLRSDTAYFRLAIVSNLENQQRMSHLIRLLKDYSSGMVTEEIYYLARSITSRGITPHYNNRTFEQLKQSGGLRLIRKSRALDSLTNYYESLKDMDIRVAHRLQRLHNLFLVNEDLFDGWALTAIADSGFAKPLKTPPLLTTSRNELSRYVTRLGYYKAADKVLIDKIVVTHLPEAERMIQILKKEYQLK